MVRPIKQATNQLTNQVFCCRSCWMAEGLKSSRALSTTVTAASAAGTCATKSYPLLPLSSSVPRNNNIDISIDFDMGETNMHGLLLTKHHPPPCAEVECAKGWGGSTARSIKRHGQNKKTSPAEPHPLVHKLNGHWEYDEGEDQRRSNKKRKNSRPRRPRCAQTKTHRSAGSI